MDEPLLAVDDVHVMFDSGHGPVRAIDGVSLDVRRGEVVALVGESGCGKTTLLRSVLGLEPITSGAVRFDGRYPHEISGGQPQRVLIAGAIALSPQLLLADEPVASLDASVGGEILLLLRSLVDESGLSIVAVTHDLGMAWNIADRIAVMYLGKVVELGTTEQVLGSPQHPYTKALLSVVPETKHVEPPDLSGEIPDPSAIPAGCRFHPRCPTLLSGTPATRGQRSLHRSRRRARGPRRRTPRRVPRPLRRRPATDGRFMTDRS